MLLKMHPFLPSELQRLKSCWQKFSNFKYNKHLNFLWNWGESQTSPPFLLCKQNYLYSTWFWTFQFKHRTTVRNLIVFVWISLIWPHQLMWNLGADRLWMHCGFVPILARESHLRGSGFIVGWSYTTKCQMVFNRQSQDTAQKTKTVFLS